MGDGLFVGHCDNSPDFLGDHLLWLQSACGNIRAVHGHRSVIRSIGGYSRPGFARILSGFLFFRIMRA